MLTITASPFGASRRAQTTATNTSRRTATAAAVAPPAPSYPAALPCRNLYDIYPEEVGPTANVLLTNPADLPAWLLVARPVPQEEAEVTGGCLAVHHPARPAEAPLYLCLTDSDDTVYGRAAYIARQQQEEEVREKVLETLTEDCDDFDEEDVVCTDVSQGDSATNTPVESPLLLCLATQNA